MPNILNSAAKLAAEKAKLSSEVAKIGINLLFLLVFILILNSLFNFIKDVMTLGCKQQTCRFITKEGFETSADSSAEYFKSLSSKCDKLNNSISTLISSVENIDMRYIGLKSDICYVTNQVDEGIAGNYASNVPPEEQNFSPSEQAKRAEIRKKRANRYLANTKAMFVKNNNTGNMIECFEDVMTDEQTAEIATIRDSLNEDINNLSENLSELEGSLAQIQGNYSDDNLQSYFTTLAYNEKYLKIMLSEQEKAKNSSSENFETLDFSSPVKKGTANDPTIDPAQRIAELETRYNNAAAMYSSLINNFDKYNNTVIEQRKTLNKAKLVINDKAEQDRQMQENMSKVVKS